MAQVIKRLFRGTDSDLIFNAHSLCNLIGHDLPEITPRFPWLDATWKDNFQAEVSLLMDAPNDISVLLDNKVVTEEVNELLKLIKTALNKLKVFAGLAFAKDDVNRYVQGKALWAAGKNKTLRVATALNLANNYANKPDIKPELLGRGYTQTEIDELDTLKTAITEMITKQASAITDRQTAAQARVDGLNKIYTKMQLIGNVAEVVWQKDITKLGQYTNHIKRKIVFTYIVIRVLDEETAKPLAKAVINIPALPKQKQATTNKKGIAKLTRIKFPASVILNIACEGYKSELLPADIKKGHVNEVVVRMKKGM